MHNSGFILGDNESETIKFIIDKQGGDTKLNDFIYYNYVNEQDITINGGTGSYYYIHGDQIENFENLEDLIRKYILDARGNGTES